MDPNLISLFFAGTAIIVSVVFGDMAAARYSARVTRQLEAERLRREQVQLYLLLTQILEV